MKVCFFNVDFNSSSGPNSFANKLASEFNKLGVKVVGVRDKYDILLSFISDYGYAKNNICSEAKLVLRLDGIWFNSIQDWKNMNKPIVDTYGRSDGVIFQSEFNKKLTFEYFGVKNNCCVINNGDVFDVVGEKNIRSSGKTFCCCSDWRPHKRLGDIIEFYIKASDGCSKLIVIGDVSNCGFDINQYSGRDDIVMCGKQNKDFITNVYRGSDFMVHLAWLDHCPNVVVEAIANCCPVICTNSGGTKELVNDFGVVYNDFVWDFKPHNLYNPPTLNIDSMVEKFLNVDCKSRFDNNMAYNKLNISSVANKYVNFFKKTIDDGE